MLKSQKFFTHGVSATSVHQKTGAYQVINSPHSVYQNYIRRVMCLNILKVNIERRYIDDLLLVWNGDVASEAHFMEYINEVSLRFTNMSH